MENVMNKKIEITEFRAMSAVSLLLMIVSFSVSFELFLINCGIIYVYFFLYCMEKVL
jgi:hypothetical protein